MCKFCVVYFVCVFVIIDGLLFCKNNNTLFAIPKKFRTFAANSINANSMMNNADKSVAQDDYGAADVINKSVEMENHVKQF